MKYCKKCVMPDTRPNIKFHEDGICAPCKNEERKATIDWDARWEELEALADKYRGSNGDYYDCIITASGGKDSHYQVHVFKELLGMNPLVVSIDNFSWTETGRDNWSNLLSEFGVDAHVMSLNPQTCKKMFRKAFFDVGSPTWYFDGAIYAYPIQVAIKLGIPLVIYGENTNYERGGAVNTDIPSALEQINNDVVKPIPWEEILADGLTMKDVQPAVYPSKEAIAEANLNPVFLSYYVPWSSHKNYEFAKSRGFKSLEDEWMREGFINQYDQIDSVGYVTHAWMKFPKFGHWISTDYASLYIREGRMTREEALKYVNEEEYKLDKKMLADFLDFTGISEDEFWVTVEKFANPEYVEKRNGEWRLKEPAH
jgi:N-acetyl sugar amidotransferase